MPAKQTITGEMTDTCEPDWAPLLAVAPHHVDDFMWMFEVELADGTRLQAYKHYWTRRYMHLSSDRRAFVYIWNEDLNENGGRYEEVAICWLFDLALKRPLYPPTTEERLGTEKPF